MEATYQLPLEGVPRKRSGMCYEEKDPSHCGEHKMSFILRLLMLMRFEFKLPRLAFVDRDLSGSNLDPRPG
jgi:hypothetical protein